MKHTGLTMAGGAVALWACGCGWLPQTPPPEAQVEIVGGQPSELTAATPTADDPYAGMGRVAKGSSGVDRSAWPRQWLQIGRPVIRRRLVALQNPAECATRPDPEEYWTWRDAWPAVWSLARLVRDMTLLPVEVWYAREAPAPPPPAFSAASSEE